MDYTSRWPEAIPMPDQEATTIAQAFVNKIVSRWGVPKHVVTDQGANFTSAVLKLVYHKLGIQRNPTTPYHPQSDGLVERFNRTLKDTIFKLAADFEADWDEQLDWALGCYRFNVNKSLKDSPYFVMTGQDPRTPFVASADQGQDPPEGTPDATEWKREFFERMQRVTADATRHIEESQAAMKARYDRSIRPLGVKPGDLVKVRSKTRKPGRKLLAAYKGPYRVIRFGENSDNVVVVDLGYGKEKHLNVSMVEPYFGRNAGNHGHVCVVQATETAGTPSGFAREAC
jgi:hypothetical protein